MASGEKSVTVRPRKAVTDDDIADVLNDSELDFSADDSDEDPEFIPPEFQQGTFDHRNSESSSSDEEEMALITSVNSPTPSTSSNSSNIPPTRGRHSIASRKRGCSRGRGRGRGRGVGLSSVSTRQVAMQNNAGTQDRWANETLETEVKNLMQPAYIQKNTEEWEWYQFFDQYIDDDIFTKIVDCTNRTYVLETGKSMGLTIKELKIYIGITMIMSALQYPQISMYWAEKWKVPLIVRAMTRNRFFFIRLRLKCVYDAEVTAEQKIQKIWKIQPLFDRILSGCHEQNRPQEMSIDEMIIPFTGKCPMRQYCPNKPNPVGLKVFVLASPKGVVCDMVVYQGDTTFPDLINRGFSLGESAIIHLTRTLVPGHLLFFDRFFTTAKLCDELLRLGFHGTGTIMKNRIPKDCVLTEEKTFKRKSRGSSDVKVRDDNKIAVTMWLDNKPVLMMSTCYCNQNQDECERWSKKDRKYVTVTRPNVIKKYNENMGGVDLADRMLSVCPSRNRTKKWTIRVMSHLFDLCVVNSWLQYKIVEEKKGTLKNNIVQLREYKLKLGSKLIDQSDNECESDGEIEFENLEPKHKKRKVIIQPVPSKEHRTKNAAHLPEYGVKQSRCRNFGCDKKTTVFCKKCGIYLCFTPNRNCFINFHED